MGDKESHNGRQSGRQGTTVSGTMWNPTLERLTFCCWELCGAAEPVLFS